MNLLNITILFICTCSVNFSASGQQQKFTLPSPPNTVKINNDLWIDEMEVSNIHWLEYLHYLEIDSAHEVYKKALPDSTVFNVLDKSGKLSTIYHSAPGYRHFPVVGISYEQAIEFCKWRSLKATEYWRKLHPDSVHVSFEYRLPTNDEWMVAASGGVNSANFPFGYKYYFDKPFLDNEPKKYYSHFKNDSISYGTFKRQFKKYLKEGLEPFQCDKNQLRGKASYKKNA